MWRVECVSADHPLNLTCPVLKYFTIIEGYIYYKLIGINDFIINMLIDGSMISLQ